MFSILKRLIVGDRNVVDPSRSHEFRCVDIDIELPSGHGLLVYQSEHPRYDRFLPHLSKFIPSGSTVIDVGANCADTVAAMVQSNPDLRFICVEPDDDFYAYLLRNLLRIKNKLPQSNIVPVKAMIGKAIKAANLAGVRGTKHAVASDAGRVTVTIDSIVTQTSAVGVRLLKSDVDGFDFDVLAASSELLASSQPVVFFECQYDNEMQFEGFKSALTYLESFGYVNWTVFDNFGELMLASTARDQIEQLMEYVWRQNRKLTTRTIFYFDILAFTERDVSWVSEAISSY